MINFTRLKDIREDHDLTQEEMASIIGTKRSTYSLWELGINIIPLDSLNKFANYFKLNVDYILSLTDERVINKNHDNLNFQDLGKKIKKIRKDNGLSQKELADILKVSQPCVNKYEQGKIEIPLDSLYKFSVRFNVSLDDLIKK